MIPGGNANDHNNDDDDVNKDDLEIFGGHTLTE